MQDKKKAIFLRVWVEEIRKYLIFVLEKNGWRQIKIKGNSGQGR